MWMWVRMWVWVWVWVKGLVQVSGSAGLEPPAGAWALEVPVGLGGERV